MFELDTSFLFYAYTVFPFQTNDQKPLFYKTEYFHLFIYFCSHKTISYPATFAKNQKPTYSIKATLNAYAIFPLN